MLKLSNKYLLVIIFSILSLLNGYELYSQGESLNSNIYATLITRKPEDLYSIQKILDLQFGDIGVTATSGTVIINPQSIDNVTYSGGVVLLPSYRTRAQFLIKIKKTEPFSITYGQTTIQLQNTNNPSQKLSLTLSNSYTYGITNGSIQDINLYVGGTLDVRANQPKGSYVGTFVIKLNNQ